MFALSPLAEEFAPISADELLELDEVDFANEQLAELDLWEEQDLASRCLSALAHRAETKQLLHPESATDLKGAAASPRYLDKALNKHIQIPGHTQKHIMKQNKSFGRRKI